MALVPVSRQFTTEDNTLIWEVVEVEEADLLPHETPYREDPLTP